MVREKGMVQACGRLGCMEKMELAGRRKFLMSAIRGYCGPRNLVYD